MFCFAFLIFFALRRINAIIRIAMAPRPHSYLHCLLANPRWALGGCMGPHFIPILPSTPFFSLIHFIIYLPVMCWSVSFMYLELQPLDPTQFTVPLNTCGCNIGGKISHPGGTAKACSRIHWWSADWCSGSSLVCMFVMQRHCMTLASGVYKVSGFT